MDTIEKEIHEMLAKRIKLAAEIAKLQVESAELKLKIAEAVARSGKAHLLDFSPACW